MELVHDRPPPARVSSATTLIGIDDTDNVSSRGTGFLAQRLIAAIHAGGLARVLGATRHQLLDDPAIPSTSHNSSACIAVAGIPPGGAEALRTHCARFLEAESAPGSDPGLVVAPVGDRRSDRTERLIGWGRSAQSAVLELSAARELAAEVGVDASGHGGTEGGIIGALAAVGLHLSGSDGFFLWMPDLRELGGRVSYDELRDVIPVDAAWDPDGREPDGAEAIDLGDWVRPVWVDGRAVLLVLPALDGGTAGAPWRVAPRYAVRAFSERPAPGSDWMWRGDRWVPATE